LQQDRFGEVRRIGISLGEFLEMLFGYVIKFETQFSDGGLEGMLFVCPTPHGRRKQQNR